MSLYPPESRSPTSAGLPTMAPEPSAPPHIQTYGLRFETADISSRLWRRVCSCGWRGMWLRNPDKIRPCPRAQSVQRSTTKEAP